MIDKRLIVLDQTLANPIDLITYLSQLAFAAGYVSHAEEFKAVVLAREEELPTAIGFHVAIPHGVTNLVKKPFIAFCRISPALIWGQEKKEVNLVFLLGIPKESQQNLHLKVLSQLSRNLLNQDFRESLMEASTPEIVVQILKKVEAEINKEVKS